ncbi:MULTISPECIES: carboxylate--amine ligase [unclassified Actinomyces]|uniref:carboxylate--amine ligase n=1 Tax=unclassified Actinomyces TaxID=2609248 RepID=UPI0020177FA7|nr:MULTISPECIES: carboxylate--amine ligase [unclassified Actinomyces]MCL3778360.1 carboxylate--amine ligase [Actinomyces sp. AC-20-1]MCL3789948.1 carboxylate--amine ligase [Actinomyces sp. 187325]MCL3792173.1 carboxylate--amine ligase [Actinomyces sp. 186855]MCL3794332.1 carboxylate--amine ligase [Actinomyces sp. 217892]
MPQSTPHEPSRPDLLPVVIGGDIGAYALARQLHDATGQRVTLLSASPIEAINLSSYIDVVHQGAEDEDALLSRLLELVDGRAERSAVVIGNRDSTAAFLVHHRDELEPRYVVPFPDAEPMERLSDKISFAEACASQGVRTPRQVVVDCSRLSEGDPGIDIPFPLIGKAAVGSDWDNVSFEGKRKIYVIDTPDHLASLWQDLRRAGYTSTFLIQERVPGEDDAMRSITAYIASNGEMTMIGSARVLLEDHAPSLIGNPVAMITEPCPELWDAAERLLTSAGYRGFANFDVKVDPRTGEAVFFELNPRIGRNSFYMSAAGVNPMVVMISDLVDGRPGRRREARKEVLYSLVPLHLVLHQLDDTGLRRRVLRLAPTAVDPLIDPRERSLRRRVLVSAQKLNHDLKFHRHHPRRLLRRR